MPTTIKCPTCKRALEVPDELMGKRVKCPACKLIFTAALPGAPPAGSPRAGRQSPDSKSDVAVRRGSPKPPPFEIEEEDEEQPRVRKKAVRRRDEEDEEDEEEEKPRVRRKAAGRRVEEDDDEEEDDEDEDEEEEEEEEPRPRRRRAGKSPRQRAQSAVLAPAICLITAGGLGLLLGLALLGLKLAGKSLMPDKDDDEAGGSMLFLIWILSQGITWRGIAVSTGWGVSVLGGGIQMKNLSNFKTVVSACIVAMLPGNCFCLLGLPIGIWGLVAINRWDVKREFD